MKPNVEDYFDPVHYINWDEVEEQEAAEESLCSGIISDLKSRDEKILSLQKELDEYKNKLESFEVMTPARVISAIKSHLTGHEKIFNKTIHIEGRYSPSYSQPYGYTGAQFYYDKLINKDGSDSITVLAQPKLHNILIHEKNIVRLRGRLECKENIIGGNIQVLFRIDGIDEVTTQSAISKEDLKRIEIIQQKSTKGRKNVISLIENKMMKDETPNICLIYAASSITDQDFKKGIQNHYTAYKFKEERVPFTSSSLTNKLKTIDSQNYDAICLIRGGGSGLDTLDDIEILKCAANLNTPFIAALGHDADKLYLKDIADYASSTPNGLGADFYTLVERVSNAKNSSKDAIFKQVEKQFKTLIETKDKQIKDKDDQIKKEAKNTEVLTQQFNAQLKIKDDKIRELANKETGCGFIIAIIAMALIALIEFVFLVIK